MPRLRNTCLAALMLLGCASSTRVKTLEKQVADQEIRIENAYRLVIDVMMYQDWVETCTYMAIAYVGILPEPHPIYGECFKFPKEDMKNVAPKDEGK